MRRFTEDDLNKVVNSIEEESKVFKSGQQSDFAFLPKGNHTIRFLPDATPKFFAAARVHTVKNLVEWTAKEDGQEVTKQAERNVTVLCGKGPDGSGYCPICEWVAEQKKAGNDGAGWLYARTMLKFPVYIHDTDNPQTFRDKDQWKKGMTTVAVVTRKDLSTQIIGILRKATQNTELLKQMLNVTEEEVIGVYITYPTSKDASAQVSFDPTVKIPPIPTSKFPDWYTADDFDVAKVYVDFTQPPTTERLQAVLDNYIENILSKSEEDDDSKKDADLKKSLHKLNESGSDSSEVAEATSKQTTEEDVPWDDDISRVAAKPGEDKPACFGNFVASDTCASCAYMAECIEHAANQE